MFCPYTDVVKECTGQCWACIFERSDNVEDATKKG